MTWDDRTTRNLFRYFLPAAFLFWLLVGALIWWAL